MSTYRIQAGALLRLATIAAAADGADPTEIMGIVQGAEAEETLEPVITMGETSHIYGGGVQPLADGGPIAVPPAKPEE